MSAALSQTAIAVLLIHKQEFKYQLEISLQYRKLYVN